MMHATKRYVMAKTATVNFCHVRKFVWSLPVTPATQGLEYEILICQLMELFLNKSFDLGRVCDDNPFCHCHPVREKKREVINNCLLGGEKDHQTPSDSILHFSGKNSELQLFLSQCIDKQITFYRSKV